MFANIQSFVIIAKIDIDRIIADDIICGDSESSISGDKLLIKTVSEPTVIIVYNVLQYFLLHHFFPRIVF